MKVAIVGSVSGVTPETVLRIFRQRVLKHLTDSEVEDLVIVSGGAAGVDSHAEYVARLHGIPCIVCKPGGKSWPFYKKRNLLIAELCDRLIRIHSTASKTYGSGWTADRAEALGKPVERIPITPDQKEAPEKSGALSFVESVG